jgi:hypothetical protein
MKLPRWYPPVLITGIETFSLTALANSRLTPSTGWPGRG